MKKMTGNEIIRTYIEFFKERGHSEIESANLIPHDDPSVLWINAGVTPLKKYFDGTAIPANRRMTSCQKCIRTGDIESVGLTARHHTFFQMLGNFSVGDYFKTEALTWAMELLTSPKYFGFDKDKLYVTIYPNDLDAYNLWVSLGMPKDHIIKLEGNYWEIGQGPSGPDSEIFYDRGPKYDKKKLGIKLLEEEIENDRYIEIWNNVFSQFNAKEGVPREKYEELPSKNIDTGMGVERMACIMQKTETNYETDLFMPIINKIEEIASTKYKGQMEFKVIADHIRTITFALSDGATFENYGRGYVLRRLLRRASRMGRKLNIEHAFMASLVDTVVDTYNVTYPELEQNRNTVKKLVTKEEELFQKTLLQGEKLLNELFKNSQDKVISGEDAFKLYDTYGYPIELTEECASEHGFMVDDLGFKKTMEIQKETARRNRKVDNSMNVQNELLLNYKEESKFIGYDTLGSETEIIGIIKDNEFVKESKSECYIFLKENPFYAEMGGQVSDKGYLKNDNCRLEVLDVIKCPNKQHLLKVKVLKGLVRVHDKILTHVDAEYRAYTARNHSATHILQKVLQDKLGNAIHQAGSRVDANNFRFDFNYRGRLSDELILEIEKEVRNRINENIQVKTEIMSIEDAKKKGAMALFEDKYDKVVRVVTIGSSIELCGGTHVKNTKEIGDFAILRIENKGSDTFRCEGATNDKIDNQIYEVIKPYQDEITKLLVKAKELVNMAKKEKINVDFDFDIKYQVLDSYQDVVYYKDKLERMKLAVKRLEKDINNQIKNKSLANIDDYIKAKEVIGKYNVIIKKVTEIDTDTLKELIDNICNQVKDVFVLIANVNDSSANYVCKSNISNDKLSCGDIIRELAKNTQGGGGGNKTFATGGGKDISNLDNYLKDIKEEIKKI